jgi:metal-responsive CopG/Arc/MetJ family transcriptional regulator
MVEADIALTAQERDALDEISQRTGKTHSELIHEAVEIFISEFQIVDRRALMQKAKGIWKDRQDLPTLEDLRREWNRI